MLQDTRGTGAISQCDNTGADWRAVHDHTAHLSEPEDTVRAGVWDSIIASVPLISIEHDKHRIMI